MKSLACVFALMISGIASAGMIFLKAPPNSNPNLVPVQDLPFTYVLGFEPETGVINGVCGYRALAVSGRGSTAYHWFPCQWDLQGNSLGLTGIAQYRPTIPYGPIQYFDDPVTGGMAPVFVVAIDGSGNVIGVLDEYPRVAVLVTP
jgi:hypothetical protein